MNQSGSCQISTVAGNGASGYLGDGGPATLASFDLAGGLAAGADGSFYIADTHNDSIRKVDPTGIISTVAGLGVTGFEGDGGAATQALLSSPWGIAVDLDGTLWIADSWNHRIRRVDPSGTILTVAGAGRAGTHGSGEGVAGFAGDGGPAERALLNRPTSIALDGEGGVVFLDDRGQRIRRISPDGTIDTLLDTGISVWGAGRASDLAIGPDGSLYYLDDQDRQVFRLGPEGQRVAVAGCGDLRYKCGEMPPPDDGQPALSVGFMAPAGIAVDAIGNIFVSDTWDSWVRRVNPGGTIVTVAGGAKGRYAGDGGPATDAVLMYPESLAITPAGGLLILDTMDFRVRLAASVAHPAQQPQARTSLRR